jgi:hypothetical protein
MTKRKKKVIEELFASTLNKADFKTRNRVDFLANLTELSQAFDKTIEVLKEVRYKTLLKNNRTEFDKLADIIPIAEIFKYNCDESVREADNDLAFICYMKILSEEENKNINKECLNFINSTKEITKQLNKVFDNDFNSFIEYCDDINSTLLKDIISTSSFTVNISYIKDKVKELKDIEK